ncbi:MAG: S41 family peptidase [Steroidobacteraceae bacterium]
MQTGTWRTSWRIAAATALLALVGMAAAAQAGNVPAPATGRLIPAADLQADAAVLRRAYETLHPGLYRYRTKAQIDAAFAELDEEFARDRTLAEAYLAIARLTTFIQCGHTYPNFFNQGVEVERALLKRPRVPFEFRWLDRRMVVTRAYVDMPGLQRGTEVLSIDGRPVAAILEGLLPYSRADGGNDAKRVSNLEVQGFNRYEAFDVFFPLVFPRDESLPFVLKVRTSPGGKVRTRNVPAITPEQRIATADSPDDGDNPWSYAEVAAGVGLLTMPTWALYDSKFAWESYLDALFGEINAKGTGDLIIDLRANEGGLSVGDRILAHLMTLDLPAEPLVRKTRYRKVPDDLRPVLETWDRTFYDWGDSAVDLGDGFYRLTKYDTDATGAVVKALTPRYAGRVWVLIGAVNSSATFEFANAVRRNRLGTLVGQATGGNQRGITGGAFFFLRLPKTGIEADVPLIGQFPLADKPLPDAGLEPDVYVQPRAADIAAGRDAELTEVLRRIAVARY